MLDQNETESLLSRLNEFESKAYISGDDNTSKFIGGVIEELKVLVERCYEDGYDLGYDKGVSSGVETGYAEAVIEFKDNMIAALNRNHINKNIVDLTESVYNNLRSY